MTQTLARSERSEIAEAPPQSRRLGVVLVTLLSAMFMAQFDFFVVNVAAPSLERDLNTGAASLTLVVGGYAFAYASGMVTGGRLGDMYGHRRVFVAGVLAFAVTSLLCGVSLNAGELIGSRLLQGFAGALMVPQVLAVITAHFPAERRPKAVATYGMAAGLGAIAGQVLGGALVEWNVAGLGWRSIFLVNVPIGLVAAFFAWRVLPRHEQARRIPLDPLGALGLSTSLALVLVPLSLGQSQGWPLWCWVCMAAGVPVGLATLKWQRVVAERGGSPILDLRLFASPSFRAGMVANTAFMLYFGSFMFTLTLLLQLGLGLDPLQAGLVFSPMGVAFSVTSLLGPRILARFGVGALVAASAVTAAGLLLLTARLWAGGTDGSLPWAVVALCLVGLGNGVVLPSLIRTALMKVQPAQAGVASGALVTAQQFASSAGVAVLGALFFALVDGHHYGRAMASTAAIDMAMVLAVLWTTWTFKRLAEADAG
jgi:EmrB/QacA subfamily drug resistance transporter